MSEHIGLTKTDADDPDMQPEKWQPEDYIDLRGGAPFADRGAEVIEGLLRVAEVLLVGSSSKHGKSWMVGNLIWAAIMGTLWLGRKVRQGKVLLIDNELKRGEIDWRHDMIAKELQYTPQPGELNVIIRRGKNCDIHSVRHQISLLEIDWSEYSLIVIDAIYKCIPGGASENDNAAMGDLMNTMQGIAETTGVPVVGVHHSTKGQQGDKAVLDVFAGAGSFGRSLDSAVVMRDHEQPELSVIDFVTRSNPPQPPVSAKFDWPLWSVVTASPEVKRQGTGNAAKQAKDDEEADELLQVALTKRAKLSESQLVRTTGMGPGRVSRAIGRAIAAGTVEQKRVKRNGRRVEVYIPSKVRNATENATAQKVPS